METTIGVVSDTHGLLREEAGDILKDCDLIIHAGDICGQEIIKALQAIQRTIFVRGNMDWHYPGLLLLESEAVEFADKHFYVLHDLHALHLDPQAAGLDAVIHGHTHQPDIFQKNGVLFLNPGSIGPKRHGHPVSLALIHIVDKGMRPEIITLEH